MSLRAQIHLITQLTMVTVLCCIFLSLSRIAIVYILKDVANHFFNHKTYVNISYFVL